MVFFTCSECGQSVKKNQVEKHCSFQCRNCKSLSCMDCGTEFWGDDYKTHTKCITEDEKYGGKNYTPKPSANKGEVKQEKWIEHIKNTIATKDLSGPLSELLQKVIEFPNIPRKKSKFQKFVENSLKVKNPNLISEAWDIFAESTQDEPTENAESTNKDKAGVKRPADSLGNLSSNKKVCPDPDQGKDDNESDSEDMEEGSESDSEDSDEENANNGKENGKANDKKLNKGNLNAEEDDESGSESEDMEESTCSNCGKEGHDADACLSKSNLEGGKGPIEANTNQGSGGKSCFKCGQEGHMSRECTEGGGSSGACYNCNEEGHQSRNCPQKKQGGRASSGACYNCNEEGHQSRECPQKKQGGRASSGACYNCNEEGHLSRDCPQKKQGGRASSGACFNCNEEGHQSRNCPQKRQGGRASSGACYNCNEEGHLSRDCPQKKQGGRASSGACYNCNEEGHLSRDCPQKKQGGRSSSGACFKCNEEGHQSRNCPNGGNNTKGSNSRKSFKFDDNSHQVKENGKEMNGQNGTNKEHGSFDVRKACEKVLEKFPDGIPKKQLRKQVMAEYKASVGDNSTLSKDVLKKQLKEVLTSDSTFSVNSKNSESSMS